MHYVSIEDDRGDLIDLTPYCSDSCARTDPLYAGWYGCQEGSDSPEWCARCGVRCGLGTQEGCDWECLPIVVNLAYAREDPEPCRHGVPTYIFAGPDAAEFLYVHSDEIEAASMAIEASQELTDLGRGR